MSLPSSTVIVVKKGPTFLLVKNKEGKWTFPGGHPDPNIDDVESILEFACAALFPFFTGLIVHSVHLLLPVIQDMVWEDERARVAVFKCEIEGKVRIEAEQQGLVWFAPLDVPPHAVSPDASGIIEMLAAQNRSLRRLYPKE